MKLLGAFLFLFFPVLGYTQGCSDAGFCTIGDQKGTSPDSLSSKHKIAFQYSVGIGDAGVFIQTPALQYDIHFSSKWSLQAKGTYNIANGNLGTAHGLGDLYLAGIFRFGNPQNWKKTVVLGTKLPLSLSNIKENNLSLPMQYQSSLGTVDLISAFTISNQRWLFATAIQQPLSGTNGNQFLPEYWDNLDATKYPPGNDFNRKGDVLLRAQIKMFNKKTLYWDAGLLGIYHLGQDTYIDGNISNDPIKIKGSEGLTLNVVSSFSYIPNNKLSFGLSMGVPLLVRDVRPDGLTRSFVVAPEILFHF